MRSPDPVDEVERVLARYGLVPRGGFTFGDGMSAPSGPSGLPAKSALLVGNAGDAFWPHFQGWLAQQSAAISDPLDTWSRRVLETAAETCGARVVMPNDEPYQPFQQWAIRAEDLKPSPLGILMHPEFGLWHAYRGALLFDHDNPRRKPVEAGKARLHLCDMCIAKPCLNACPVEAFKAGFAYESCLAHIGTAAGADCMEGGCLARNACPADDYRYGPELQGFLMRAFRRAGQGTALR